MRMVPIKANVNRSVRPRYRGIDRWQVEAVAGLRQPVEYDDPVQGKVGYDPKIVWLCCPEHSRVLWFGYWISTNKTKGKMRWGQGAPMLEENILLELLTDAIGKNFFSQSFLENLSHEIEGALEE